jgi:signal transduction histidine kinase
MDRAAIALADLRPISSRAKLALPLGAAIVYMLGFLAYNQIGDATPVLSVLPVIAAGQSHGTRGGLLTALFISPLNTLLLNLTGHTGWDALFETPIGILGTALLIFMGVAVGQLIDLRGKVAQDDEARHTAEDKLSSLSRARAVLMDGISHDLRSALHTISGSLELLRSGKVKDAPQWYELLSWAELDAKRLIATVDDLEDLTSFEGEGLRLAVEPLDLDGLVSETVEMLRQYGQSKGITLVQISAEKPRLIQGDRQRLKRVLFRLAEHAITVSDVGTQVVVLVESETTGPSIEVIDHGPTQSVQRRLEVFEKPEELVRSAGGSRLEPRIGLYVARLIIEAHGGKLLVEDQPGPGNTVRLTLPTQA